MSRRRAPELVTIATGESRPIVHYHPNGSYTCPWCGNTVIKDHDPQWATRQCSSPACWAYPGFLAELVRRQRAEEAEREAEADRRRQAAAFMADYQARRRAEEAAKWQTLLTQARDAGQCLRCLRESDWRWGRPRLVRHRTADYHEQRDAAEAAWRASRSPRRR